MTDPVFAISSSLSEEAFERLQVQLYEAIEQGARRVVLALDALKTLDATMIRQLIRLLRRVRELGADLTLLVSRPDIRRTLRVTALDKVFRIVSKVEAAA